MAFVWSKEKKVPRFYHLNNKGLFCDMRKMNPPYFFFFLNCKICNYSILLPPVTCYCKPITTLDCNVGLCFWVLFHILAFCCFQCCHYCCIYCSYHVQKREKEFRSEGEKCTASGPYPKNACMAYALATWKEK